MSLGYQLRKKIFIIKIIEKCKSRYQQYNFKYPNKKNLNFLNNIPRILIIICHFKYN